MNRRFTLAALTGAVASLFLPKTIGPGSKVRMTKEFLADLAGNTIVSEGHPFKRDLLAAANDIGTVAMVTDDSPEEFKKDYFVISFPGTNDSINQSAGYPRHVKWNFIMKKEWLELA